MSSCNSISQNIQGRVLNVVPSTTCSNKTTKFIKYIGENISSAEQRLILGATALMTQPFIDAHNKDVDEKTRKVSVARTIAKIIAGTVTGFIIRKGCIKGIEALSQIPGPNVPKWKTIFTPKGITNNKTEEFTQYRNAMGTVVGLFAMLITNFAIDAPLTKFLTNKLIDKQEGK